MSISLQMIQSKEILKLWLHGKSNKTKVDYSRVAHELLIALGDQSLKEVSESFLQSFSDIGKSNSPHTHKQRIAILKSLFKFAHKKKFILENPAEDLKSVSAHEKINERYLSQEEVFRMIDRTQNLRNKTILKVLYGAGLRVGELVNLNWGSLQERAQGEGQITVIGKRDKKRTVGLSRGVFQDLLSLKPLRSYDFDPVFISREQGRLSRRQVDFIVREAALRAGMIKKVSPHWLRHAHASHALDRGAPIHLVQATLGHASISTTGKYLHARPEDSSANYLSI